MFHYDNQSRAKAPAGSKLRQGRGSGVVELVFGLIFFVFLVLAFLDMAVLYDGVTTNYSVCREAARAAASGPPSALSSGAPQKRARAVISRYANGNNMVRFDPSCLVTESVALPLPQPALGGPVSGDVTVQSTVEIFLPYVVGKATNRGLSFTATETLPYTYTVPAVSQNSGN